MTKKYIQTIQCPYCGKEITTETAFGRWLRNNKKLDSHLGHVFYDLDLVSRRHIVHRYKTLYTREIQCLMCIEVKTHGADLDKAQKDTLIIFSQFLRNRTRTPAKKNIIKQLNVSLNKAYSSWLGKEIEVRGYGYHLLQFSGTNPEDSDDILWDRKKISDSDLIKLLKFELDPDTLRKIDLRIHHKKETPALFPDIRL